ncbi:MAG: DUF1847 domain-containing protein [Deltaproteobacteria bacterium]|nr:DUF1847 domain-containing protein [Deltaproteobacteria bacterium]MBW2151289.1 DUF1847 domain-containing protein [Deltaproteobacteria bacterium]
MDQETEKIPRCAECKIEKTICRHEDGNGPVYCPTINFSDVVQASRLEYDRLEIRDFAVNATIQEGECYVNKEKSNPHVRYAIKPRVQETIEFAHKMGFQRLGLAFCGGLKHEAKILSEILKEQGFELASVVCAVGRTAKEFLKIKEEQKVNPGEYEAMCSPIAQAKVLNAVNTEFNIVFGLCVGHDSLFMRYSDALCTVLVAKDRVTGHNPLAAINLYKSYYRKLKEEKFNKGGSVTVSIEENV